GSKVRKLVAEFGIQPFIDRILASCNFPKVGLCRRVQWGVEFVNSQSFGRHTTTQMGSDRFSDKGFGKVSYFRNLEIVDNNIFTSV
ncbi:Neprosin, partial [Arabidopsis suecica]